MHLGALQVFCDVARQRSFSQAAQANDVTQSAVSQIISQLEKRMQVQLVDRSTRPLQLTPLGQKFYDGCKTLLEQYRELEAHIQSAQADISETVRVSAIYSVGLGDMGQNVQRFTQDRPKAKVQIEYLHPDQVYAKVLDGTADLGLVSFPRKSAKFVAEPWREEEMMVVCPPKHPFAQRDSLNISELAGEKFVHFERNLTIRRNVDRFLKQQEVAVDVVLEFDNIENIKQAVSVGAGIALLPEPTVRRETKARTLAAIPLSDCRLTRPMGIIHRRQKLSSAAQGFMQLLLEDKTAPSRNGNHAVLQTR